MIRSFQSPRRASAIVICLALIVLIAVLIVAFFSFSQLQRRIEASGVARTKAEILARSGLDYTTSLLIGEIVDPKNSEEINGIYRPRDAAATRPKIQLKPAADTMRSMHVPGLIKQSIVDFDPLASTIATGDLDGRHRALGPKRWNDPYFYYSTPQFTTLAQAPDWIYFGPEGPTQTAPVLGRIAFNIYQLDGLLDLNVAGFPSSLSGKLVEINQLKATLAGADISRVSRVGSYLNQSLVDLRSRGSARRGEYAREVLANRDGFRTAPTGDTRFVSRLDLVRYALTNSFNSNSLAFVTTYSRALEAPSWMPPSQVANPFAPAIRRTSPVTITDYHLDGTKSTHDRRTDDSVVPRRFPLSRLAFFEANDSEHRTAALRDYFGLVRNGPGRWRYVEPRIRTLAELTTASREPNFFELLKAAILSPSVGNARSGTFASLTTARDGDADLHLLQIGANIIDSTTAGNLPSIFAFSDGRQVRGIKNLPYLCGLRFRQVVKTDEDGGIEQVDQFALPILVNPHAAAIGTETFPPVRMRLVGDVADAAAAFADGATVPLKSHLADDAGRVMTLDPQAFPRMAPVQSATGMIAGAGMPDYFAGSFLAFWLASSGPLDPAAIGRIGPNHGTATLGKFNVVLEYQRDGEWIVYDALIGDGQSDPPEGLGAAVPWFFASREQVNFHPDDESFYGPDTAYLHKPDPRTTRWGPVQGVTAAKPTELPSDQVTPYGVPMRLQEIFPAIPAPDGARENDLQIGNLTMAAVLAPTALPARGRSRILHRRFYTVGELGYAFRGEPWKTLDFTTARSADRALLDYFTINELPPDGVVAGRISLNLNLPDILDTQLAYTLLEAGQETTLSDAQIRQIANRVSGANLQSPADLVGLFSATTATATKEQQEAGVRALGTAGQTRTWNYFIDLIAQVGRLPPGASGNLARFIPQGESRLWMHVAIDRYTARVIDSYIEAYQE